MIRKRRIRRTRIIAAVLLFILAVVQAEWFLLLPAAFFGYQAFRDISCVICEAGFCQDE